MIHMFQQLRNEPHFMRQYHKVVTARNPTNPTPSPVAATASKEMEQDKRIKTNNDNKSIDNNKLVFVDLGSGDGRIVFHAAYKEQLFTNCIGYEINPFLHCFAILKQQLYRLRIMMFPQRQAQDIASTSSSHCIGSIKTEFYLRDLWKVNLQHVNVVAVVRYFSLIVIYRFCCSFRRITDDFRFKLESVSFCCINGSMG